MRFLIIAAALALGACNREPEAQQGAATGCYAAAFSQWMAASDVVFEIEGAARGVTCAEAEATLRIAHSGGAAVVEERYAAAQLASLAGAESLEDMQRMLQEWITPAGAAPDSTGDLPEWGANDAQPISGEFPFYVEDGVSRERYQALRGEDAPMYCYVQGMESMACLAWSGGGVVRIGVQTFPG